MTEIKKESARKARRKPLRILHLEDDPNDVELVRSILDFGGITTATTVVDNRPDFVAALERGETDLVISDFALPTFDGMSALELTLSKCPGVPFIIVSGTLGEELAIESVKRGATDYVLKDRLSRLVPAVERAIRDIENRAECQRLEAQVIEAQKVEVVGQLAGGVAHDFNNIIAIIMGYSDLMMQKIGTDSPLKGNLESIRLAAERAAGLTRQLLVFSRKQTVQPVVLDLGETVAGTQKMLRRLINENIELTFTSEKEPCRIKADPGHINQVLMNLVINARDAMPRGGKLKVETRGVVLDDDHARDSAGLTTGAHALLSVSDTGIGMTEEVKAHLFQAFFTTKPKGKGTGLGLVTCQTIVQQSGGHVIVDSELGKGTTFKVYFPRVDLPMSSTSDALAAAPLPRGTETVLVVEDEPIVRQLAQLVLEGQGYKVLTAADGQEGLSAVREHKGEPLRLVVTDVIMPQMDGKLMAEWLKSSYPDLKILFTSGYTDDVIASHGVLDAGVAFLPKPYGPAALARKVRETLDG